MVRALLSPQLRACRLEGHATPERTYARFRRSLRAIALTTPLLGMGGCAMNWSSTCDDSESFALESDAEVPDGRNVECIRLCAGLVGGSQLNIVGCSSETLDGGEPGVVCQWTQECPGTSGLGRRPSCLLAFASPRASSPLGEHFARAARLEAASVRAFRIMARELAVHGAPSRLVRAARRSAAEEVRHVRSTRRLARRFGAEPLRARYAPVSDVRSVEALAAENAAEGCVCETFGAAVAHWQALHAVDRRVARTLRGIAEDETRHAHLSWKVAAWAEGHLSEAARHRVARARAHALASLKEEIELPVADSLVRVAGLPPPPVARVILRRLEAEVMAFSTGAVFGGPSD
jgi:hypothetical protein